MLESKYQKRIIKKLKDRFPDCLVLKNDPTYIQGIPDLTIFYGKHWATLEVKNRRTAPRQPNQQYYVDLMNNMSFSRFIFPENEEEVLNELQRSFEA